MSASSRRSLDLVLSRLPGARKVGARRWMAVCPVPAHGDERPSLSVGQGPDGRVLLHCFGGCAVEEVVEALGLKMSDLFPNDGRPEPRKGRSRRSAITLAALAADKALPVDFLRSLGVSDLPNGRGVAIPYKDRACNVVRLRHRTAVVAGQGSHWGHGTGIIPYGLDRLQDARKAGHLNLVEGESNSWTLWFHEFPALGIPGATTTKTLEADYLDGIARLNIFEDPDKGGVAFVQGLRERLREIGFSGQALVVRLDGIKDVNALHKRDPDSFKGAFTEALARAEPLDLREPADPYDSWQSPDGTCSVKSGRFWWVTKDNVEVPISNFVARVTEEVSRDDGAETKRFFVVEGRTTEGRQLSRCEVSSAQFDGLSWLRTAWGMETRVLPYHKERMAYAITAFSREVRRRTIFAHLGWRRLAGGWGFVHAGGAIGAEGIEVDLAREGLTRYVLPQKASLEDVRAAMRVSLRFLELGDPRVTYPAWSLVWRALVCELLHCAVTPLFYGMTGTYKSSLAAALVAHFGVFRSKEDLPGSLSSTDNALEKLTFLAKDCLCPIDDLNPEAVRRSKEDLERAFFKLVRNVGDRVGRQRLKRDLQMSGAYYPRGLVLITGEYMPPSVPSRLARIFPIPFEKGSVDKARLTDLQRQLDRLPYATWGFIEELRLDFDSARDHLREKFERFRAKAAAGLRETHPRLADNVAHLFLGLELGISFGVKVGALKDEDARQHLETGWDVLIGLARDHQHLMEEERPSQVFLGAIAEYLAGGRAWLADPKNGAVVLGKDGTGSEKLGWASDEGVWLLPATAYRLVSSKLDFRGGLYVTERGLREALLGDGYLRRRRSERDRLTTVVKCEGQPTRVLWLRPEALGDLREDAGGEDET